MIFIGPYEYKTPGSDKLQFQFVGDFNTNEHDIIEGNDRKHLASVTLTHGFCFRSVVKEFLINAGPIPIRAGTELFSPALRAYNALPDFSQFTGTVFGSGIDTFRYGSHCDQQIPKFLEAMGCL